MEYGFNDAPLSRMYLFGDMLYLYIVEYCKHFKYSTPSDTFI